MPPTPTASPDDTLGTPAALFDKTAPFEAFAEAFLPLEAAVELTRSFWFVLETSDRASSRTTRLRAGGILERAKSKHG